MKHRLRGLDVWVRRMLAGPAKKTAASPPQPFIPRAAQSHASARSGDAVTVEPASSREHGFEEVKRRYKKFYG